MLRPVWDNSVCLDEFHRQMKFKFKITPEVRRNESRLTQMTIIGKYIRQKWVRIVSLTPLSTAFDTLSGLTE